MTTGRTSTPLSRKSMSVDCGVSLLLPFSSLPWSRSITSRFTIVTHDESMLLSTLIIHISQPHNGIQRKHFPLAYVHVLLSHNLLLPSLFSQILFSICSRFPAQHSEISHNLFSVGSRTYTQVIQFSLSPFSTQQSSSPQSRLANHI